MVNCAMKWYQPREMTVDGKKIGERTLMQLALSHTPKLYGTLAL